MAAAPALIDLGVLLALVTLIGLSFAYRYTFGALLQTLVAALNAIRLPSVAGFGGGRIFGVVADGLDKLDHTIRWHLGKGIDHMQSAWNEAVSYTAYAVGWIGREIASLSHDTAQAIEGLHVQNITNVYKRVAPQVDSRVGTIAAALAALTARVAHVEHRAIHWTKTKVVNIEQTISLPDIGAIPRTIPRVGQLERELDHVAGRVGGLAKRLAPAAIAGLVVAAIGRLGFGWVRCSRVGRVGKSVCGMNEGLLEGLLADALLVVGSISVVEFAKELQAIEGEVVSATRRLVREI